MVNPESHNALPQTSGELEIVMGIDKIIAAYFPDDVEFILQQLKDEEDVLAFLYGQLNDIGEDADEIFAQYGITEG